MQVIVVPTFSDNYSYLCVEGSHAVCIDPGEAGPIHDALTRRELTLIGTLVTHGHHDHIGGLHALQQRAPHPVAAPAGVAGAPAPQPLEDGADVRFGGITLRALATPGHCPVHFAFYAPGVLFAGDALFAGGCGRLLGGTARQLWASLGRLAALPGETALYGGHNYAEDNYAFGLSVLPGDPHLVRARDEARQRSAHGLPTVPTWLRDERQSNIFLRSGAADVAQAVGLPNADPLEVFTELRRRKDRW